MSEDLSAADSPAYWQQRYIEGNDRWDKGFAAPPLTSFLARYGFGGEVLVPGCGAGHDVRALARVGARVTGLDFAPAAIEHANSFPKAGDETYMLGDFLNLPAGLRGRFDGVFEHTLFCAIPPERRPDHAASCHAALREGGRLLAIFYLNPGHEDGPPWGVTRWELDLLFGPLFRLEHEEVPAVSYEGREGRELLRLYIRKI
ncbi:MAG: TPMT family class I SAM-dependent methyltransferase [Terrimicrobiaceae bacterium]|nr:TPMT family class I SAM-dependent methyltransferase [Terrimicrobiaceae bacterium]